MSATPVNDVAHQIAFEILIEPIRRMVSIRAIGRQFALVAIVPLIVLAPKSSFAAGHHRVRVNLPVNIGHQSVPLSDTTLRSFEAVFSAISDADHVAIIVEGVPLRQVLTDQQLADLKSALSNHKSPSARTLISTVGSAYDYECEASGANTYLLRKRYTDQNDLPCVTYGEIVHSLKSILSMLDPGSSRQFVIGKDSVLWTLYDALSEKQRLQGPAGLAISDLTVDQRSLALQAAREGLVRRRTRSLWEVEHQLQLLREPSVIFTWMKLVGGEAFGYQGPFRANGATRQFPLNNGFRCEVGGAYSHSVIHQSVDSATHSNAQLESGAAATATDRPVADSEPTDIDRILAPGMLSQRLPSTITLAEAVARVAPSAMSGTSGSRASVDDAISEKPVCIYGRQYIEPATVLRGIASVYNLRIIDDGADTFRIALPMPRLLDRAEDAGPEIFRLMPSPFIRYWRAQEAQLLSKVPSTTGSGQDTSGSSSKNLAAVYAARSAWYLPAVRRLLVLSMPSVPHSGSPPVPVASIGSEALRLISLIMLAGDATNELAELERFVMPHCISNPDSLVLKIQMHVAPGLGGQQLVLAGFGSHDRSGSVTNEGGFGNSRKPPTNKPLE